MKQVTSALRDFPDEKLKQRRLFGLRELFRYTMVLCVLLAIITSMPLFAPYGQSVPRETR